MPEVLVIDDNPTQLCVREAVLRGAGLSVLTASSAEQATQEPSGEFWLAGHPHRHVLPSASGGVFVRELREFSPSVPVLVISGMDEARAGIGRSGGYVSPQAMCA